jgi:ParB-like chromosome segregation protein Spo0J
MARLREQGSKMWEAYGIDPRKITIKPSFNPRDTTTPEAKAHIAWLKTSIASRGVDEPIFVENDGDKLFLIDGECRLLACRQLWDEGVKVYVPAISYTGDEKAILAKSLIANNGLPLSQLELGGVAQRLMAFGWPIEKVAAHIAPHLGFAPPTSGPGPTEAEDDEPAAPRSPEEQRNLKTAVRYTKDAVELHQAPLEVKEIVKHGIEGIKVSPATAIQEVRKSRSEAPTKLREAAAKAKAAGKKEVKRPKEPGPAAAKKQATDVALAAAETMALAIEVWTEDATDKAEKSLLSSLRAYRKLVPAPKAPKKGR